MPIGHGPIQVTSTDVCFRMQSTCFSFYATQMEGKKKRHKQYTKEEEDLQQ
jgi:hypothetical protein